VFIPVNEDAQGLLLTSVEHFDDSAEHEAREGEIVDLERNHLQIST
jgi:hypothetical protein